MPSNSVFPIPETSSQKRPHGRRRSADLLSNASSTTTEPLGGTTDGEVSPSAKAIDFIRLDRFACRRFELHHIVAIADEDAGYSDGGASVGRLGTKLLIAALIMHLPVHPTKWP